MKYDDVLDIEALAGIGKPMNPYNKFINAYAPNWLLRRNEVSPGAKLLYARLIQYAGKNTKCFPKYNTLAKELGRSPRTIARLMRELIELKLIRSIRVGKRCSNRYIFLRHQWMEFADKSVLKRNDDMTDMTSGDTLELAHCDATDPAHL